MPAETWIRWQRPSSARSRWHLLTNRPNQLACGFVADAALGDAEFEARELAAGEILFWTALGRRKSTFFRPLDDTAYANWTAYQERRSGETISLVERKNEAGPMCAKCAAAALGRAVGDEWERLSSEAKERRIRATLPGAEPAA